MNPYDVIEHDLTLKARKAANALGRLDVRENTRAWVFSVCGPPSTVARFRDKWPETPLGSRVWIKYRKDRKDKKPRTIWAAVLWYALPAEPAPTYPDELDVWLALGLTGTEDESTIKWP